MSVHVEVPDPGGLADLLDVALTGALNGRGAAAARVRDLAERVRAAAGAPAPGTCWSVLFEAPGKDPLRLPAASERAARAILGMADGGATARLQRRPDVGEWEDAP